MVGIFVLFPFNSIGSIFVLMINNNKNQNFVIIIDMHFILSLFVTIGDTNWSRIMYHWVYRTVNLK